MIQLLTQIIDLQTMIEPLIALADARNRMVMTALRNAQESLESLKALVSKFEDEATLIWFVRHWQYGTELRTPMNSVEGYIRALRLGGFGTLPAPQQVFIDQASQGVAQIIETIDSYSDDTEIETKAPAVPLSVEEALAPVWPILRAYLPASQFNITFDPGAAPIVYHPVKTTMILMELCLELTEPRRITDMDEMFWSNELNERVEMGETFDPLEPPQRVFHIDAQPASDAFAIVLRVEGLLMTPNVWERSLDTYWLEDFYELGGSLMPLTWDEGMGQGVIVQLPWARDII